MPQHSNAFPKGATLVFGGSGGIGQEVAKSFGAAGSDVAIVYRSKREVAERVVAEITAGGRKASAHAADVRDVAQVQAAVTAAIAAHGRIHTVVWAAGPVVEQLPIADTPLELWRKSVDIEVHGFFTAVQATLPHLRESGGGSYVHLGSAGHVWWPAKDGLSVAPKAANEALCKGIAKEEGRHNIRANSVLVGEAALLSAPATLLECGGPATTPSGAAGLAGLLQSVARAELRAACQLDRTSSVLLVVTEGA